MAHKAYHAAWEEIKDPTEILYERHQIRNLRELKKMPLRPGFVWLQEQLPENHDGYRATGALIDENVPANPAFGIKPSIVYNGRKSGTQQALEAISRVTGVLYVSIEREKRTGNWRMFGQVFGGDYHIKGEIEPTEDSEFLLNILKR